MFWGAMSYPHYHNLYNTWRQSFGSPAQLWNILRGYSGLGIPITLVEAAAAAAAL